MLLGTQIEFIESGNAAWQGLGSLALIHAQGISEACHGQSEFALTFH